MNNVSPQGIGIDRSISLLLFGVAVVTFVVLTMAGMQTFQTQAKHVKPSPETTEAEPEQYDFAD